MRTKVLIVLATVVLLLVACDRVTENQNVACPAWAGYEAGSTCDFKLWDDVTVQSHQTAHMHQYEKVRLTVQDADFLISEGVNVVVFSDTGGEIDYVNLRLKSGVYIFEKIDPDAEGSFKITSPFSVNLNVVGEFVRLH